MAGVSTSSVEVALKPCFSSPVISVMRPGRSSNDMPVFDGLPSGGGFVELIPARYNFK